MKNNISPNRQKQIADTGGKGEEGWGVEGRKSPSVIEGVASAIINLSTCLFNVFNLMSKTRSSSKYIKQSINFIFLFAS